MIQFEKFFDRKNSFLLIAGPCAIEDENIAYEIASKIYEITEKLKINFVFKKPNYFKCGPHFSGTHF